jgi:hypothetical protein
MTPKAPGKTQKEPERRPGVEVGDELYVHHEGQPCTCRVAAHGKHGVTGEIDGAHHKITWDKVLGHKSRVAIRGQIIDQGEDGMLLQDQAGRRRYVATPNEAKEDPLVIAKAFDPRRPVLLFKGGPLANRPGLVKKQVTDKNGVQTQRWVSTDQAAAPAQPGRHVGFVNGAHRGHGQVTAAGQHGVTVKDDAGGEHRVRHGAVTHHWEGGGKPTSSPHEARPAADAGEPPAKGDAVFDQAETAKLPKKVNQPHKTWEDLVKHGTEGLNQFKEQLSGIAKSMGLVEGKRPDDLTPEDWASEQGFVFVAPLKSESRAKEKVMADYDGDWSQLRDIVRATISVPTMADVKTALAKLKESGVELAQQPKDRFAEPTSEGYRDAMTIVKLPNGMLAELQVHVKAMTLAKDHGHHAYGVCRSLRAKYNEPAPTDAWSDEDHTKFYEALKEQKDLYGKAWAQATAGAQPEAKPAGKDGKPGASQKSDERPLQKSQTSSKMIMLVRKAK